MACFIGVMAGNDKVATQLLTVCSKISRWSSSSTDMIFCSKTLVPKRRVSVSTVEDYAKNILRFWSSDFVVFVATVALQRTAWNWSKVRAARLFSFMLSISLLTCGIVIAVVDAKPPCSQKSRPCKFDVRYRENAREAWPSLESWLTCGQD